ncbi:MATH domain and coiled-coil domain-containing protein At3g58210-like [Coffea arabica]|uniref:MATH domain and coiled-coil domain-containing protein At3g58210-like n=1 Tax=Coffea arabica TaxID=13443 RepID=A0ABM4VGP1_COFAR
MKLLRDKPPAHYILQIDSFSLLLKILEKSDAKSYDSMTFEACGYKWKLSLYPNGDQKRNAKGFISLYLRIEETNALPVGWEINLNCTFFVLDQIQEKYLTIQDVCGKFRHLYALKKDTGLSRLMQLDVFKDEENGYLIQDKCVFGVEVSVNSYKGRGECLAMPVKPSSATYTWKTVDSCKSNEMRLSDVFTRQGFEWDINQLAKKCCGFFIYLRRLKLFPRGTEANKGKNLSLYLESLDSKTTLIVYAEFKLRVKHQLNGEDIEKTAEHLFTGLEGGWGFGAFQSLNDIADTSKGFLVNGTLIVEVEFVRISSVKSFTEGCGN